LLKSPIKTLSLAVYYKQTQLKMAKKALALLITNPNDGQVLPKIASKLGVVAARKINSQLLMHANEIACQFFEEKKVFYPSEVQAVDMFSMNHFEKVAQNGWSLSARIQHAFENTFNQRYNPVVLVNTNCPDLNDDQIREAFFALKCHDLVMGPTRNGSFYLIGLRKYSSLILENINWEGNEVESEVITRMKTLNLSHHLLPELGDLQSTSDLEVYNTYKQVLAA